MSAEIKRVEGAVAGLIETDILGPMADFRTRSRSGVDSS